MKKIHIVLTALTIMMLCAMLAGCGQTGSGDPSADSAASAPSTEASSADSSAKEEGTVIDYMVLVNKESRLPEGWEDALQEDLVKIKNSQDLDVAVEKASYDAYLELKAALEEKDIHVDLDSAYRSVAEQQTIWDDFTEKYGKEYTRTHVAVPGYSEHQTGLALDLYLQIDGKDIVENEDLVQYPEVWEKIHKKLADYGFILRYLPGKADITGYSYEPWHIRYVGDKAVAKEITDKGITLEEYLDKIPATAASIDYKESKVYSKEDMDAAILVVKKEFENWKGCELHSISYAGDQCNSDENISWAKELKDGKKEYAQVIQFTMDFHSPKEEDLLKDTAWEPDSEYEDYQWYLARENGGEWELVSSGYN